MTAATTALRQSGQGAIVDLVTFGSFVAALLILYYRRLKEPYVVGIAAVAGIALFRFHG
jgi:hypothetical protein